MSDEYLHKLKKHDAQACRALYEEYKVPFFSLCRRYANSEADANDMLQEGFMEVFKSITNYKKQGNFKGYIRKVFLNKILQYIRKNYRQLYETDSWTVEEHDTIIAPDAIANLRYEELLEHIKNLPDGARAVFNLYAIDGYRHAEIAELLGISVGTSRSQYSRAKTFLQKEILKSEKIKSYE